jgi:hypothetical protein
MASTNEKLTEFLLSNDEWNKIEEIKNLLKVYIYNIINII